MTTDQPAIKVGDHVRLRGDDEYLGKVIKEETRRILTVRDERNDLEVTSFEEAFEVAPRLTPDEAWAELPYLILAQLNKVMSFGISTTVYAGTQSAIRHEAYKLLGGAGIKITDEVKARVRKAIERIADAMGVELG